MTTLNKVKNKNTDEQELTKILSYYVTSKKLEKKYNANLNFYNSLDVAKIYQSFLDFKSKEVDIMTKTVNSINRANFTYVFPLKVVESDEAVINIKFVPKNDIPCSAQQATYRLKVVTEKGVKIDFSTGILFNLDAFDYENLTYRTEASEDPTKATIVKNENRNVVFPAITALMHIYKRTSKNFTFAGTFGLSTTEATTFNFHTGISAIIGRNRRVVLSFGGTLGQVSQLKSPFEEGVEYEVSELPDDIPTENVYRFGLFTAITYNL